MTERKVEMKKTCNGCKVFTYRQYGDSECCLGYKIETYNEIKTEYGEIYNVRPLEECPKPKANDELYRELKNKV